MGTHLRPGALMHWGAARAEVKTPMTLLTWGLYSFMGWGEAVWLPGLRLTEELSTTRELGVQGPPHASRKRLQKLGDCWHRLPKPIQACSLSTPCARCGGHLQDLSSGYRQCEPRPAPRCYLSL